MTKVTVGSPRSWALVAVGHGNGHDPSGHVEPKPVGRLLWTVGRLGVSSRVGPIDLRSVLSDPMSLRGLAKCPRLVSMGST